MLHLMICICWAISAFLRWSWLCHGIWSFLYIAESSLPSFYWGFLHQCSLRRLACNSPFWRCTPVCLTWFFFFFFEIRSCCVAQAFLEVRDLLGIPGELHHARLVTWHYKLQSHERATLNYILQKYKSKTCNLKQL
jgi:hypothetical protein